MIKLHHCKNEELFPQLKSESIDIICIDPPYKYLKNQKLEVDFDEKMFFGNCKRVLSKNGFIILFGRGTSFYRWNVVLENMGFNFKEEIIWDKSYGSSPLMAITRVHETISIFCKGDGVINKVKVPYIEQKRTSLDSMANDIKRLISALNNEKSLSSILQFLSNGDLAFNGEYEKSTTITSGRKRVDQSVSTMQSIKNGMNEKTIIKGLRDHYTSIHPTQKPVRLLERLIQLCLPKKERIVIADFFGGSMSTMEAVYQLQKNMPEIKLNGISCEVDEEYYSLGKSRIDLLKLQPVQINLF